MYRLLVQNVQVAVMSVLRPSHCCGDSCGGLPRAAASPRGPACRRQCCGGPRCENHGGHIVVDDFFLKNAAKIAKNDAYACAIAAAEWHPSRLAAHVLQLSEAARNNIFCECHRCNTNQCMNANLADDFAVVAELINAMHLTCVPVFCVGGRRRS